MPHGQPDRLLDRGDAGCSPPAGPRSVATSCQPNDEPSESGHGDVARQHERQIQSPLQFVVPRSEREFVLNHFDTSERPVPASRRGNGKRKVEAMPFEGTARKSYRRSAPDASARFACVGDYDAFSAGVTFPQPADDQSPRPRRCRASPGQHVRSRPARHKSRKWRPRPHRDAFI
jgi:hypothetical protein